MRAIDGAVLGWICLTRGLAGALHWSSVTAVPQDSVYLAIVRHIDKEIPAPAAIACADCACRRFLTGDGPPPHVYGYRSLPASDPVRAVDRRSRMRTPLCARPPDRGVEPG
ncbi:MAG: hypothetical protein M5R38_03225 [Candidatus Methylomirabilis sp.]|nr:hypothetical protein [Candidatus Methylomirabilis sp.]